MKQDYKIDFSHLVYWGLITLIVALLIIDNIVANILEENTFKPDFKFTYSSKWDTYSCELNAGQFKRQDAYDLCPYITKLVAIAMNDTNVHLETK